jgi:predicted DNA-binding protein with PD1-like motif
MTYRLLHENDGQRTFVMVLEIGEEVMAGLTDLARSEHLGAAQITGIGAFSEAVIRYFSWTEKRYEDIVLDEQVEVASLIGDIAQGDADEPIVHVHLVLGRHDGSAAAGHLAYGMVRPTLELIVTESPAHLRRRLDPETGLCLIALPARDDD